MTELPPELRWMRVYVTGADLTESGIPTSADDVHEALRRLSVFDCLRMLGRLSANLLLASSSNSHETQQALIDAVASPAPELHRRLSELLAAGHIAFFPQQLYHLVRLSLIHGDRRPPDDFEEGRLASEFLLALFGVSDSFEGDLGDVRDADERLSWALRQTAINHSEERLTQWSFYYELFEEIWPSLDKAPDADNAFKRYTGLTITEYLTLGFAMSAGFGRSVDNGPPQGELVSSQWFSKSEISGEAIQAFLRVTARSADELRLAVADESATHGGTTFGSLALEQTPIVEGPEHRLYAPNLAALERRSTHGIFHVLAEGAVNEGSDRETYTSPFGAAFQVWAERCFERMEGNGDEPRLFADVRYGPKGQPRDTSDVVLRYERQIVAVEVVAGALRIRTLTHGDIEAFNADLEKFVFKKARQLTRRIADIQAGETREIGLDADGVGRIWPVIVTAAPFPVRAEIMQRIRRELKERQLLQAKTVAPLSILSAEELAAAESDLETSGDSFLDLLVSWKGHARTGDIYLKNFLFERGHIQKAAAHHERMFGEASRRMLAELFRGGRPPDQAN
jgi:hypothetical protein